MRAGRIAALLLASSCTLALCPSCRTPDEPLGGRAVVDESGRSVHLPARIERIAAVRPGALRLVLYVDGVERVVAVESMETRRRSKPYLMAFPELAELPSLGPPHGGDAELIAGLGLDVVFTTRLSAAEADQWQARTGVSFVVIGYGDLGEGRPSLDRAIRLIGRVLVRRERAEEVIGLFDEVAADLARRTGDVPTADRREAYVAGVAYRGAHGVASTEPRYDPFEMAGVRNVAGAVGSEHAFIDRELLVAWDPDHLFVDQASTAMVLRDLRRPEMAALSAVREGRVFGLLPYNWYWTNFGTVMANAYAVGEVMYPERFDDLRAATKAREIYRALFRRDVYDQMRELYGGYGALELR